SYPISYAYNGQIARSNLASINSPSTCIGFWEAYGKASIPNYAISTPTLSKAGPPHPVWGSSDCALYVYKIPLNTYWIHAQQSNYLYLDGHVKSVAVGTDYHSSPWAALDTNGVPQSYWSDDRGCAWLFRPPLTPDAEN